MINPAMYSIILHVFFVHIIIRNFLFFQVLACFGVGFGTYILYRYKQLHLEAVFSDVTMLSAFLWLLPSVSVATFLLIPLSGCYGIALHKNIVVVGVSCFYKFNSH